jgi:hypothetical protein
MIRSKKVFIQSKIRQTMVKLCRKGGPGSAFVGRFDGNTLRAIHFSLAAAGCLVIAASTTTSRSWRMS